MGRARCSTGRWRARHCARAHCPRRVGGVPTFSGVNRRECERRFSVGGGGERGWMDKEGAMQLDADILGARPDHADTLARVSAIVQREPQSKVAVNALLAALRLGQDRPRLAEVLELRVGAASDFSERKALPLELAEIRKAQSEPELEYLALFRAFKEDPNAGAPRAQLDSAAQPPE